MRSPLKRPRVIGFLLGALPLLVAALRAADCNGNGIPDDRDLKAAQLVFSAPLTFPTGFSPWAVVAVDLEGDGDPDLVTANTYSTYGSDRTLSVLLNDGWGNFGPATVLNVGAVPKTVAITDLDSDGQPDLISANYFSRDLSILLNRGGDKFTEAVNLPLEGRPLWVVTGDFDGDQRSDLAVALEKSSQVRILLHRRDGTFEAGAGAEL